MPASTTATDREEEGEPGQQSLADGFRTVDFLLRSDIADAEFRSRVRHFPAQRGYQGERILAGRAHDECGDTAWAATRP